MVSVILSVKAASLKWFLWAKKYIPRTGMRGELRSHPLGWPTSDHIFLMNFSSTIVWTWPSYLSVSWPCFRYPSRDALNQAVVIQMQLWGTHELSKSVCSTVLGFHRVSCCLLLGLSCSVSKTTFISFLTKPIATFTRNVVLSWRQMDLGIWFQIYLFPWFRKIKNNKPNQKEKEKQQTS